MIAMISPARALLLLNKGDTNTNSSGYKTVSVSNVVASFAIYVSLERLTFR